MLMPRGLLAKALLVRVLVTRKREEHAALPREIDFLSQETERVYGSVGNSLVRSDPRRLKRGNYRHSRRIDVGEYLSGRSTKTLIQVSRDANGLLI